MEKAKTHYNGIMLLTSYVQRLYVAQSIAIALKKKEASSLHEVKELFDRINAIVPVFEQTRELTDGQLGSLKAITERVQELMDRYFNPLNTEFTYKLGIVGSSLYGEQQMNNGVIRLGELFHEEIHPDFFARVKMYEERTKMINYVVHLYSEGNVPEESIIAIIEQWYEAIIKQKDYILQDITKITEMLS